MKTLREKIRIMTAADEGATIERRNNGDELNKWFFTSDPSWNWEEYDYRVEPLPPKDEWGVYNDKERFLLYSSPNKSAALSIYKSKENNSNYSFRKVTIGEVEEPE